VRGARSSSHFRFCGLPAEGRTPLEPGLLQRPLPDFLEPFLRCFGLAADFICRHLVDVDTASETSAESKANAAQMIAKRTAAEMSAEVHALFK